MNTPETVELDFFLEELEVTLVFRVGGPFALNEN